MSDSTSKRKKPARNPETGTFEPDSPLNDAAMLSEVVEIVRACATLEKFLLAWATSDEVEDEHTAKCLMAVRHTLKAIREPILEQLVVDKSAYRRATNKILTAPDIKRGGGSS